MGRFNNFYQSQKWRQFLAVLKQKRTNSDGLLICEHCGKPIIKAYDCIGHHKIELNDINVNDANVALNPDNIMLIHHECHNQLHKRFGWSEKNVFIVHGAPCSGKSTFLEQNAADGDLVLCLDKIYSALTKNYNNHQMPVSVKPVAFSVRDAIFDCIKTRKGNWHTAWVLSTKTGIELERDRELLGARLIEIDTPESECLKRLNAQPDGRDAEKYTQLIADYFIRREFQDDPPYPADLQG